MGHRPGLLSTSWLFLWVPRGRQISCFRVIGTRMVGDNFRAELPNAQSCPRASGDRKVWRIETAVWEGLGFSFTSLYLLLKKTTWNDLTLNKDIRYASCRPDCLHVKPRKKPVVIILNMEKLRLTEVTGLVWLARPGISTPHTHIIISTPRREELLSQMFCKEGPALLLFLMDHMSPPDHISHSEQVTLVLTENKSIVTGC